MWGCAINRSRWRLPMAMRSRGTVRWFVARWRAARPAGLRAPAVDPGPDLDRGIAALRSADWAFIGPGSPSYAIRQLRDSRVGLVMRDRLGQAGATIFSSAAACALGRFTLPVYEIYK